MPTLTLIRLFPASRAFRSRPIPWPRARSSAPRRRHPAPRVTPPRCDTVDEMLKLSLVGALAGEEVGALTRVGSSPEQLDRSGLRAVGRDEGAAPSNLDRIVELTRIAPLPLHMGDGASRKAQRHQCVIQAVVLSSHHAPGVDPLDLAKRPAQEVEVVDEQVQEHAPAYAQVGVPVVPPGKERRATAGAHDAERTEIPSIYHRLDPLILREEADHVPDKQPLLSTGESFDDRLGVLEGAGYWFLQDDVLSLAGGLEGQLSVVGGREAH